MVQTGNNLMVIDFVELSVAKIWRNGIYLIIFTSVRIKNRLQRVSDRFRRTFKSVCTCWTSFKAWTSKLSSLIIYRVREKRNPVNLEYFNSEIKPTFPKQTRAEVWQAGNLRHRGDEFFKQPHNTRLAKQKIQNVCVKKGNIHGKLSKYNLHPKSWR